MLIGVQGNRLVLVIGRADPPGSDAEDDRHAPALTFLEIATQLEPRLRPGAPRARPRGAGARRRRQERAGRPRGLRGRPRLAPRAAARRRPTTCCPSAPSRATRSPRATLVDRIYRPLQAHSTELLTTLWSYLDNGRSLEATARELFVHPNTVRYRLKRVSRGHRLGCHRARARR